VLNDKTERQIRGLPEEAEVQDAGDAARVLGVNDAPAAEGTPADGAPAPDGPADAPRAAPVERLAQPNTPSATSPL